MNPPRDERASTVGVQVQVYRLVRQLSRRELSEAADIGYSTLGRVEAGVSELKTSQLVRIAEVLDVPVTALLVKEVR